MQKHWLKRIGAPDLIVVALGWASEPRLVQNIPTEGHDVLVLYDYRTLEPLAAADTAPYGQITLLAWSFGVWVAEQVCRDIPFRRAVALNGTPLPVDARYGIPPQAMAVTRQGIRRTGTDLFDRRAYGTYYDRLSETLHTRPLEELCDELDALSEAAAEPYRPNIEWSAAVVGGADRIFPPAHMAAYWKELAVPVPDMLHYPFGDRTAMEKLLKSNEP